MESNAVRTAVISGAQGIRGSWDEVSIGEVTWTQVEDLIGRLGANDLHSLQLVTNDEMTQLVIVLGENGRFSVNWHTWDDSVTHQSYILVDDDASEAEVLTLARWNQGGRYPARELVDRSLLLPAARAFFHTATRAEGLPWSEAC